MRKPSAAGQTCRLVVAVALVVGAIVLGPADAAAQPPAPPDGFVAADSLPAQEQLPAAPLVLGAYAVAWALVFGYLWSIWQRLGRVERELATVARRVEGGGRR